MREGFYHHCLRLACHCRHGSIESPKELDKTVVCRASPARWDG
jgi:hypothetical protein